MAKVIVLKGFAYGGSAGTRASTVHLNPGPDEVDILDALVPGLVKEGFVRLPQIRQAKPSSSPSLPLSETKQQRARTAE